MSNITKISDSIINAVGISEIYLFGSHAYGRVLKESDLDICVITNLQIERKIDLIRKIRKEINRFYREPLDILIYSKEEFEERANIKNTLEHKIKKDGKIISDH